MIAPSIEQEKSMNHNCHGEFFTVAGARNYRCFADSSIVSSEVHNGESCPRCGRTIVTAPQRSRSDQEVVADSHGSATLEQVASQAAKELGTVLGIGGLLEPSDLPMIRKRLDEVVRATNAVIAACEQWVHSDNAKR